MYLVCHIWVFAKEGSPTSCCTTKVNPAVQRDSLRNVLSNGTIISPNLAEYPLILSSSANGLVGKVPGYVLPWLLRLGRDDHDWPLFVTNIQISLRLKE